MTFSFCEPVTAGSATLIHVRQLTQEGKMLGGGADTPALCGREVAWDLPGEVDETTVAYVRTCPECVVEWSKRTAS